MRRVLIFNPSQITPADFRPISLTSADLTTILMRDEGEHNRAVPHNHWGVRFIIWYVSGKIYVSTLGGQVYTCNQSPYTEGQISQVGEFLSKEGEEQVWLN